MVNPLEIELAYYESKKTDFLKSYEGKYLLIKGKEFIGSYDTAETAFNAGVEKFGAEAFLVRRITQEPEIVKIPALTLGLLHAHP
ncbi:MAG TPA: hypothetical protein DF383_13200 [Deltaproteobacteria bacterium]|nr:hypothetical protein [Deltaproteobacteria bacterium]